MNANDLLEDTDLNAAPPLTQEDYDRAAKLNAGIAKLEAELDDLKARIKAEAKLGTAVHGTVVVKVSERNDKDVAAMTEAYPAKDWPGYYKPVLDPKLVEKIDPADLIFKPTIKVVSITFAS